MRQITDAKGTEAKSGERAVALNLSLRGHELIPDCSGALYWPGEATLLVADLHLEKGAAFARRGQMLPPYDSRATLRRLGAVIAEYRPRRVIALGDSFHTSEVAERLPDEAAEMLARLQAGLEWIWVTGNHDPELPSHVGGSVVAAATLGGLTLRHEPTGTEGEVAGHLHPTARISRCGEAVRRKCFVTDGDRLVLPAFGAYTGGLDIFSEPFAGLFVLDRLAVWLTGRSTVYPLFGRALFGG